MPSAEALRVKVRVEVDYLLWESDPERLAQRLKARVRARMQDGWELSKTVSVEGVLYLVFTMQWVNHPGREP